MSEVSVVITTRDRPARLRAALASALAQERVALEVIVVDDGSPEPAAAEVARLVAGRARLIRHPQPRGVSRARNAGVEAARAPWVAFLDDDDLWAPGKLAAQLAAAARTGAGLVHTSLVVIDAAGAVVGEMPAPRPDRLPALMAGTNAIGTPSSVMARAELLRAVGGFDPGLSITADWDLMLRLLARTTAAACPEHLTAYTEHAANMSVTRADELGRELRRLEAKHGAAVGGRDLWRWVAAGMARSGRPRAAGRLYLRIGVRERDPGAIGRGATLLVAPAALAAARRARARRRVGSPAWLRSATRAS